MRIGTVLQAAAAILLLVPVPGAAQHQITIYRCTDAQGALLIQNDQRCPAGHRQETQVVDVPPALPAHVPRAERMPEVVAKEEAAAQARIARLVPAPVPEEARTPPPGLFRCTTWENTTFVTGDETPAERCAPIRIVGLDGRASPGLGSACEKRRDTCQAVPDAELCDAWRRRVDEAEFRWKFARAEAGDPRRVEHATLAAVLQNSTCAR